jgi:hypothetical protein
MTHDPRSPSEIERDIEYDRSRLTENLEALQDRFSVDGVLGELGEQFRTYGADIGQTISRTVRDNPAAVAMTGIGLAWLVFGGKSGDDRRSGRLDRRAHRGGSSYPADRSHVVSRPDPRMKGGTVGVPDWVQMDDDDSLSDRVSRTAAATDRAARGAAENLTSRASAVRSAASERAESVASSVSESSEAVRDRAERLRKRLAEGTEHFTEEARARVVEAREAAVDARRRASAALSVKAGQASDAYDRQPLMIGALALAVGAAIGGALPRTRTEDDWVGDYSDDLMHRAERIFEHEREKAAAVVDAATDEARTIGREARADLDGGAPGEKSAAEALADKAKDSVRRVGDAAAQKADEERLGKITS